ncbi:MAG: hypothetical protein ACR2KG_07400 [Nocardioidaceae bacterium]
MVEAILRAQAARRSIAIAVWPAAHGSAVATRTRGLRWRERNSQTRWDRMRRRSVQKSPARPLTTAPMDTSHVVIIMPCVATTIGRSPAMAC